MTGTVDRERETRLRRFKIWDVIDAGDGGWFEPFHNF